MLFLRDLCLYANTLDILAVKKFWLDQSQVVARGAAMRAFRSLFQSTTPVGKIAHWRLARVHEEETLHPWRLSRHSTLVTVPRARNRISRPWFALSSEMAATHRYVFEEPHLDRNLGSS